MIRDKSTMYRLLARGAFGNTVPMFFSTGDWEASGLATKYPWWGVRSLAADGPCRLNCPSYEVPATCLRPDFVRHGVNISPMIDRLVRVTLWAEVWDSPAGLVAYGVEHPPREESWRQLMPTHGRHWEGLAARMLLARHLNPNSRDDLAELIDLYPNHVIELSACDRPFGTVPHRNAVVWEVRSY